MNRGTISEVDRVNRLSWQRMRQSGRKNFYEKEKFWDRNFPYKWRSAKKGNRQKPRFWEWSENLVPIKKSCLFWLFQKFLYSYISSRPSKLGVLILSQLSLTYSNYKLYDRVILKQQFIKIVDMDFLRWNTFVHWGVMPLYQNWFLKIFLAFPSILNWCQNCLKVAVRWYSKKWRKMRLLFFRCYIFMEPSFVWILCQ